VEVNKNIPESQHFVEECEKFDQTSPLKRKIDKLKKVVVENPIDNKEFFTGTNI